MNRDYGQKPPEMPMGGGGVPPPPPPLPVPTETRGKRGLGILAAIGVMLAKFKGLILPALKFLPILIKTGGSMFIMIWFYAQRGGWPFAIIFVLLIFVHECGHILVARHEGLKVSAPLFIPFVGALILLKEMPRNAWMEAKVAIGGPMLGSIGAAACLLCYPVTGNILFVAVAFSGFLINLFNLIPLAPLDGGRVVTVLSPWFWLVGLVLMGGLMILSFNIILLIVILVSLPRLFTLFRKKTALEESYYQVTSSQRWTMGLLYVGLAVLLVLAMAVTQPHLREYYGR